MPEPTHLGAVILAAGSGSRLGGVAKALLPMGGRAPGTVFLDHVVATARAAGTETIVVVVGPPFGPDVAAHAGALGVGIVENPDPSRGMASSIALGFGALLETTCQRAWLWPVDHPHISIETLHALLAALADHDAARPVVGSRGGHPPLVARSLFGRLAACVNLPHGARDVLASADVIAVAVGDAGTVHDVDTPEDLA